MKKKKNSLEFKVWFYLLLFSFLIIFILWLLQVVSLQSYYELKTKRDLNHFVEKLKKEYNKGDYRDSINKMSFSTNICVEVYSKNMRIYSSSNCNTKYIELSREKSEFILSNKEEQGFEIKDDKLNDRYLLKGIKLEKDIVAFVQASLVPLDTTKAILTDQLFIVTIAVILLSVLVAIFISKIITKPVEKLSELSKNIAKGDYDYEVEFTTKVSELSELIDNLKFTSKELSKTESLRRELLANVSHDIKTPLTMIKAYAEMVRDITYKNKDKRNENLNIIIKEADRLDLLVNDILELSKFQSKTITLEYSNFDINALIKEIIKRHEIFIIKEDYYIEYVDVSKKNVWADRKRIEQVVYNILNNAINYCGEDKKITINVIEKEETIRIEIKDNGKGIAPEELPFIWDKYYKADKTYIRKAQGSGIGLSIVKNILTLHNSNYGVESELKKGTCFYFELKKTKEENIKSKLIK